LEILTGVVKYLKYVTTKTDTLNSVQYSVSSVELDSKEDRN